MECNGEIPKGIIILWCKGIGVKHKDCPKSDEITHHSEQESMIKWRDSTKYDYTTLQDMTQCQRCGGTLPIKGDSYIDDDRRVCSGCFGKK